MLQQFSTFNQAEDYLNNIPRIVNRLNIDPNSFIKKQTRFLELIGNPHLNLKVIHVAGTSGKGSTVTVVASILLSQKFKVAYSVSPHIGGICERFQINGRPISQEKFLTYFNKIIPAINQMVLENNGPSYFEILTALQFWISSSEKMDYVVTEVGMGGRLDATNIFIPNKICIINSIGLDHVSILGDTLVKIAGEKAGIIQDKNQVIALSQTPEVNQVFIDKATEMKADLDFVIPGFCFTNVTQYNGNTYFDYIDQDILDRQICLGMLGKYQAANASLALRAVETLSDRDDWTIDWDRLKYQLQFTKLIGRFEVIEIQVEVTSVSSFSTYEKVLIHSSPLEITGTAVLDTATHSPKGWQSKTDGVDEMTVGTNGDTEAASRIAQNLSKTLVLDGAHNPQKMNSFVTSLVEYYPDRKLDFLLAFKKGKDVMQMIDEILIHRDKINTIILSRFDGLQDTVIESQNTAEVAEYLTKNKFTNFITEENLGKAYDRVKSNTKTVGVITGSLYLISAIKKL
jgi:dihydrofolate synthase / folylpolyglutamate synthase